MEIGNLLLPSCWVSEERYEGSRQTKFKEGEFQKLISIPFTQLKSLSATRNLLTADDCKIMTSTNWTLTKLDLCIRSFYRVGNSIEE